jgi:hypothetical protein
MATHLRTWSTNYVYSGTANPATYYDQYGQVRVYLDSQSVENNTSSIYIDHYVYCYNAGTYLATSTTVTSKYKANNGSFGGTSKSVSKDATPYETRWVYLGRTWHTINHNANGTATLWVSGSIYDSASKTTRTSSFGEPNRGNTPLPTIPRMSTVTATRANIGEVSQLTVSQRNTAFTHSIKYEFGGLTGYILADGTATDVETKLSETSIGFTIPTSFYEQIPGAKEGQVTLTITTYNGDTKIGSAQTTTFFVDVADNEENRPNLTVSVVDINDKTKALTDVDTKLIKGYSTASISYEASGNNFATITGVTLNGETVTESPVPIPRFSAEKIEVIATDSRTFSTTKTPDYTLIEYFNPTISIKAKRTAPTEDEILLSFSGNIFNKSFGDVMNELSLSWVYRIRGKEDWIVGGTFEKDVDYVIVDNTYQSRKVYENGIETNEISLGTIFSYKETYEIGVKYGDKLFDPIITSTTVSKGKPILNWNDKMVNVNGDLYINGEHFSGGDTLPIGAIVDYDGDTVPEGYEIVAETTYSTEEQKTGETWIDGRPIYRKVIDFGLLNQQGTLYKDHNIKNLGQIVTARAIGYVDGMYYPIPFAAVSSMFSSKNIGFRVNSTQAMIGVGTTTDFYTHTAIAILEYTKTTD